MVFGHARKGRTAIRRNIESGLHDCRKSGAGTCIRTHLRMSLKLLNLPTSLLYSKIIYWLPFNSRIQYKIALICFRIDSGTAPPYLSELLHIYSPSRCLRSAWILGSSVFLGCVEGPWGRDPVNISDLSSGNIFLCQAFVFTFVLKAKTENPSLLFCILICRFLLIASSKHQ